MRPSFQVRAVSLTTWRGVALASLLVLSFLPARLKVALHTRGCFHNWAHLYVFAGLALLMFQGRTCHRGRVLALAKLFALGLLIEVLQAHLRWSCLELPDVLTDLLGVTMGAFAGCLLLMPTSPVQGAKPLLRPSDV